MKKKNLIFDILLNLIGSSIPIVILQLISLPIVGAKLGRDEYGLIITLISLFTLLSVPFGNVLNNIRLLLDNEYKEKNIKGDFNALLALFLIISSILMWFGITLYIENLSLFNIIFIIIISCLILLREYLLVSFRLTLNYKSILYNNFLLGIGYLLGTYLFYLSGYWHLIYITGSLLSLIFILQKSNLLREPYLTTVLFRETSLKSLILFSSVFLKNLLVYADKLILFPLLGAKTVSIYYSATIFGKMISMIITPVNSVILSYLTRMDKFNKRKIVFIILIVGVIGIIGYFLILVISRPLLYILYPDWAEESIKLIYLTSATAIVGVMSSVLHPFILRFNSINWQLLISGVNAIVYIISTLTFYNFYGLIGFCLGILIANIIQFIIMIFIMFCRKNDKLMEN